MKTLAKFNCLDPEYLKSWKQDYDGVFRCFAGGTVTLLETVDCLRHLGFKDDALKTEMLELQKARREAQGPALKLVVS